MPLRPILWPFSTLSPGFTSIDDRDPYSHSDTRVVRMDQVCDLMASAEKKMAGAMPPDATHLPLDPPPVAVSALTAAVKSRAGSLSPYPITTMNFNVTFITPVHIYGTKDQAPRPEMDFGNWSEYLADYPRAVVATPDRWHRGAFTVPGAAFTTPDP